MGEGAGNVPDGGRKQAAVGIACILVSTACFGCMPILARFAYRDGVDVPTLLALRFTIAGACLWTILAWRPQTLPRGRGLALLVTMGAVALASQACFFFTGITMASVRLVTLLFYLYPVLVTVLARVVFRHPITWVQGAAVAVALGGTALTIGRAGGGRPLGILLGLLSALSYSIYLMAGSRIPAGIGPTACAAVISSSAAVTYVCAVAVRGPHLPGTPAGWAAVLGVAVMCGVLGMILLFEGFKRVGPVRTSIYSAVEPMVTLALAVVLLDERFTMSQAAGGVLILGAVVLLAQQELRSNPGAAAARRPALRPPAPAAPPPTAEA
jgi:drug/metabolite transporter (DMT)-like permease